MEDTSSVLTFRKKWGREGKTPCDGGGGRVPPSVGWRLCKRMPVGKRKRSFREGRGVLGKRGKKTSRLKVYEVHIVPSRVSAGRFCQGVTGEAFGVFSFGTPGCVSLDRKREERPKIHFRLTRKRGCWSAGKECWLNIGATKWTGETEKDHKVPRGLLTTPHVPRSRRWSKEQQSRRKRKGMTANRRKKRGDGFGNGGYPHDRNRYAAVHRLR